MHDSQKMCWQLFISTGLTKISVQIEQTNSSSNLSIAKAVSIPILTLSYVVKDFSLKLILGKFIVCTGKKRSSISATGNASAFVPVVLVPMLRGCQIRFLVGSITARHLPEPRKLGTRRVTFIEIALKF